MPAPSLLSLATKACIKSSKHIEDVGPAHYDLLRPILLTIRNPHQLHILERNSPHLRDRTPELWLNFIRRDVPTHAATALPENPQSWYAVYRDLLDQYRREVDEDAERMRRALQAVDDKRARQHVKVVDDRNMRGPKRRRTAGGGAGFGGGGGGGGGRKGGFPFARQTANKRLSVPTHQLNKGIGRVVAPPKSLVETYKSEVPATAAATAAAAKAQSHAVPASSPPRATATAAPASARPRPAVGSGPGPGAGAGAGAVSARPRQVIRRPPPANPLRMPPPRRPPPQPTSAPAGSARNPANPAASTSIRRPAAAPSNPALRARPDARAERERERERKGAPGSSSANDRDRVKRSRVE